jgi:hypothetical protein
MTGNFDMLGLFATRHENSLKSAIVEREFLTIFFSVRRRYVAGNSKNLQ